MAEWESDEMLLLKPNQTEQSEWHNLQTSKCSTYGNNREKDSEPLKHN